MRGCHGYKVAKKPGYGNMTVDALVNKLHNKHFPWYLKEFLLVHALPLPQSHNMPLSVFKCLLVILPQIPQVTDLTNLSDTIQMIWPEDLSKAEDLDEAENLFEAGLG